MSEEKEDVKQEKKEVKETSQESKKKSSKKAIIITIVAIIILAIAGVAGCFVYNHIQESKTVGTDWGDTYYAYLKEAISEDSNIEDYGLQKGMDNIELQFLEVGEKNPVMVMTYEKEDNPYVNIYRTNGEEQVDKVVYSEPSTVEFLYDIKYESYSWYIHTETEENDSYKLIYTVLSNPDKNNEADYTIKKGEEKTQEKIVLSKFDEIFVKPEIEASEKIEFSPDMEAKELKENITNGVEEYKPQKEIVTEEVEKATETKVTEMEETKKSIETAKEEIKKEEERKAAEELAKGLKVGSVTLKYGKYVSDVSQMDSSMYGTIILKPDGKFHVKANCEGDYPYKNLDCDGTYKIDKILNSFEYFDGLTFTTNTGVSFSLEAHSGGKLSDQWHGYTYVGNE